MRQLSDLGEYQVKIFPANTIMIIGIGGTIGKVCISKESASCNQQINAIIVKPHVEVEFLTYYLRILREFITKCGKFTTLPIINQEETKNLIMLLPDLKEQINVVLYIKKRTQKIKESILKIEQEINLIQEYHTRLISDVVTGKMDVRNIKVEDVIDEELVENMPDTEEIPAYAEALAGREELEDSLEDGKEI